MAFDEQMAARVKAALSGEKHITEKKMFGGLCLLHKGNMLCGVDNRGNLMLRVGLEQYESALKLEHAREMDFTGKPLRGMIYVEPEGFESEAGLQKWLALALKFTAALPAKK